VGIALLCAQNLTGTSFPDAARRYGAMQIYASNEPEASRHWLARQLMANSARRNVQGRSGVRWQWDRGRGLLT
jgi:hypothetical protein